MKSQTIINRAANAAAKHDSDPIGRLSFHVGALEAEVQSLCKELAQFKPVCTGTETTFITDDGKELVIFYDADDDGFNELTGVYANGFDVMELLDAMLLKRIEEHCIDHAYVARQEAKHADADMHYQLKRDAELEGNPCGSSRAA